MVGVCGVDLLCIVHICCLGAGFLVLVASGLVGYLFLAD